MKKLLYNFFTSQNIQGLGYVHYLEEGLGYLFTNALPLKNDIKSFERLYTHVLGVSRDSLESHNKFAKELNLSFPLISDPDGKLMALYDTGRIAFLIDKQGFVQMIVNGMPDNKTILRKIEKLE